MINPKSRDEITRSLEKRTKENLDSLQIIEDALLVLRSSIFQMPEPGTRVVTSLSGGVDSVACCAILLEAFQLEVFPFFINRGHRAKDREMESIQFFADLFSKRYPNSFHAPVVMNVDIPPKSIKPLLDGNKNHDVGIPMRNSIINEYGVQYAFALSSKASPVRNVFCALVASDGDFMFHSTLTALRSQMLHTCIDMSDSSWQVSSVAIEREIGHYLDKADLIQIAAGMDMPLERSRTCYSADILHCGACEACYDRKSAFEKAGIQDKTEYTDTRSAALIKPSYL